MDIFTQRELSFLLEEDKEFVFKVSPFGLHIKETLGNETTFFVNLDNEDIDKIIKFLQSWRNEKL